MGLLSQASSGYRWNILLLLASSQVIAYIARVNFAVVGPQLISIHHYTPGQVGFLLSVFNWAYDLSLLVAGPLTDRLRPARAFPTGDGSWSLATALSSVTQSFAPLAFLRTTMVARKRRWCELETAA
jgi:ACS family D-galactonate transporter-like MFS transporter